MKGAREGYKIIVGDQPIFLIEVTTRACIFETSRAASRARCRDLDSSQSDSPSEFVRIARGAEPSAREVSMRHRELLRCAACLMCGGAWLWAASACQAQTRGWYRTDRGRAGVGAQGTSGRTSPSEVSSFRRARVAATWVGESAAAPAAVSMLPRRRLLNRAPQYYDQGGVEAVSTRVGEARRMYSTSRPALPRRVTGDFAYGSARLR